MIATWSRPSELLQTVAASVVAGVGVTFALLGRDLGGGAVRRPQPQRTAGGGGGGGGGRPALALACDVAAVVVGIVVMTSK